MLSAKFRFLKWGEQERPPVLQGCLHPSAPTLPLFHCSDRPPWEQQLETFKIIPLPYSTLSFPLCAQWHLPSPCVLFLFLSTYAFGYRKQSCWSGHFCPAPAGALERQAQPGTVAGLSFLQLLLGLQGTRRRNRKGEGNLPTTPRAAVPCSALVTVGVPPSCTQEPERREAGI